MSIHDNRSLWSNKPTCNGSKNIRHCVRILTETQLFNYDV